MKRQRGRNRSGGGGGGGGGNGGGGGGGGKPTQNANRAFDSNGPDNVKIRGHAQHVFEKYQQLARDASSSGDRVLAENYQQHAEHYFRVLRSIQPNRSVTDIIGREALNSGFDIDFEEEPGEAIEEGGEASGDGEGAPAGEDRQDRYDRDRQDRYERQDREGGRDQRDSYQRDNRDNREFRDRGERPNDRPNDRVERPNDRPNDRGERQNNGGQRERYEPRGGDRGEQKGEQRGDREPRGDRGYGRDNRERRYEPRGDEPRGEGQPAPARDPMPVVEPEPASPLLRSQDGGVSHAPAFLQAATPAPAPEGDGEPRRAPRTRTRRPKAEVAAVTEEGSDEG